MKDAMGFVIVSLEEVVQKDVAWIQWPQDAAIEGDPSKEAISTIRVKSPPGIMPRPDCHLQDRHAIIISGTSYSGEGDAFFDPSKTVALKPGSYMEHPAKAHRHEGANDGKVVLQIIRHRASDPIYSHEAPAGSSPKRNHPIFGYAEISYPRSLPRVRATWQRCGVAAPYATMAGFRKYKSWPDCRRPR